MILIAVPPVARPGASGSRGRNAVLCRFRRRNGDLWRTLPSTAAAREGAADRWDERIEHCDSSELVAKHLLRWDLWGTNSSSESEAAYRTLDARSAFFYGITGITPAMSMRLPGIGSQYLFATQDADKQYFDGAKTYKMTLPKGIPEANFWSFTLYDNQTRSMLDTPQNYPRAGSQSYPSPAAEPNADGSTTVYFSPSQPDGVKRGNWIQTMPNKCWFVILRLYSPLEPFFTKTWRPSEIQAVR
jgi:hypothetical protein